ncbi:MAG: BACON domain-containing protein, partial [Prevotellaceae bacterium]|nr:BACON domain-containing protein [Prevotellaceae bacterium]
MILIPNINPIPFSLSGVNEPKTEYAFYRDYHQKYQRSDITKIQILIPDEEPVKDWALSAERMDDATVVYTAPKETFDGVIAGHRVVEFGIDFSTFQEGTYRFILQAASGFKYRSDIICVKETHEYTRLLSYTNSYNDYGVDFSRGTTFNLRVESQLYKAVIPKSEDSTYSDNMGGYRTLSSSPYNNDRLNIGGTSGIPDWLVKIINQAFSCNILQLNGIGITKVEGATFEAVEQDNYNLRGWNIEIGHIENTLFYEEHLLTVNGGRDYTLDASFEGGANVVVVSATSGWRVLANLADWLNITPTQGGIYGSNAQVSLLRNKTKNARTNVITLRLIDRPSIAARITVTQDAIPLS